MLPGMASKLIVGVWSFTYERLVKNIAMKSKCEVAYLGVGKLLRRSSRGVLLLIGSLFMNGEPGTSSSLVRLPTLPCAFCADPAAGRGWMAAALMGLPFSKVPLPQLRKRKLVGTSGPRPEIAVSPFAVLYKAGAGRGRTVPQMDDPLEVTESIAT